MAHWTYCKVYCMQIFKIDPYLMIVLIDLHKDSLF